jgi:hypothetical protein
MNTSHLFAPTASTTILAGTEQSTEAVYRLDGYIRRIDADLANGKPTEWVYIAADGQETGLHSYESAESLRAHIRQNATW